MEVKYSQNAQKSINRMDKSMKGRIRKGIEGLKVFPPQGDVKEMQGIEYEGYMRLRVGQYRIIFRYETEKDIQILFISKIGSRGDIYK